MLSLSIKTDKTAISSLSKHLRGFRRVQLLSSHEAISRMWVPQFATIDGNDKRHLHPVVQLLSDGLQPNSKRNLMAMASNLISYLVWKMY